MLSEKSADSNAFGDCSEERASMFGKPGRPPEDAFLRRREIYMAVAPLIESGGTKRLTMRQAARAAHMSLGGLYHYFPSKRDLVLFGISPEMLGRSCADFHERLGHLAETDPARFVVEGLRRSSQSSSWPGRRRSPRLSSARRWP